MSLRGLSGRTSLRTWPASFSLFLLDKKWSGRLDSNQRPHAPQACALPGCATSRPRDQVRVRSTTTSVSSPFKERQESAEGVAQIQQHFAAQKFAGVVIARAG